MKNNKNYPEIGLPASACELCGFTGEDALELHAAENALVMLKDKMTALEVANAIQSLSAIASELTVALAGACGLCDNCGDQADSNCPARDEGNGKSECGEACAFLNGCKDGPAEWVANCSLCHDLLSGNGIAVPDYLLEEAGIPKDAKLEAHADEDSGEITVAEADVQQDITDVPPGILTVLAASGVCLAELDELIMLEEIVYGES